MFILYNPIIIIIVIEYILIENDTSSMCLIEYLCLIRHIFPLSNNFIFYAIIMTRGPPKSSLLNEFLGGLCYEKRNYRWLWII